MGPYLLSVICLVLLLFNKYPPTWMPHYTLQWPYNIIIMKNLHLHLTEMSDLATALVSSPMLTMLLLALMTRLLVSVRLECSCCQEPQLSWAELYRSCWWTVTTGAHPVSRPPTHNRQHHTRLANNNNNNNNIHLYPPTSNLNLQHPPSTSSFNPQPSHPLLHLRPTFLDN